MCNIRYWQMVFEAHAVEKIGVLRAERLRDALFDAGFVVPMRALALLVLRYMRKDGLLRFGDFVSAVLHLYRAFSKYPYQRLQKIVQLYPTLPIMLKKALLAF